MQTLLKQVSYPGCFIYAAKHFFCDFREDDADRLKVTKKTFCRKHKEEDEQILPVQNRIKIFHDVFIVVYFALRDAIAD